MHLVHQVGLDAHERALGVEQPVCDGLCEVVRDQLRVDTNPRAIRDFLQSGGTPPLTVCTKSTQPPITSVRPLPPAAPTRRTSQFFFGTDCSADVQYLESTNSRALASTSLEGMIATPAEPAKLLSAVHHPTYLEIHSRRFSDSARFSDWCSSSLGTMLASGGPKHPPIRTTSPACSR